MVKRLQTPEKNIQIYLRNSHEVATNKLSDRISSGMEIFNGNIASFKELEELKGKFKKWNEYNGDLLKTLFSSDTVSDEYRYVHGPMFIKDTMYGGPSLSEEIADFRNDIKLKIEKLDSIKDRIELYEVTVEDVNSLTTKQKVSSENNKVFIVHGHDSETKLDVARTIERLGLEAVILHEQANCGQTIIEKLESNSDVGFAIILLTADDEGKGKGEIEFNDRARQNVIAELGYFVGKLGRNRVCPLYEHGVEMPSDFTGVVYVPLDDAGSWKIWLFKELKSAGYDVDANKII